MENLNEFVVVLYFVVLSILAVFGAHRYFMVYLYYKNKKAVPQARSAVSRNCRG